MNPAPLPRVGAGRGPHELTRFGSWSVRARVLGVVVMAASVLVVGALNAFGFGMGSDRHGPERFPATESLVTTVRTLRDEPSPPWCTGPVVVGVVTDGFRPPPHPWSAGNRGWTIATEPGEPVRAAADGVVTFAGPIAHRLYVAVLHAGGLRTSYSYLARIEVNRGDVVIRGQVVGTSGSVFHLGLRDGDTYLDPALLIRWRCPWRAVLVPLEG